MKRIKATFATAALLLLSGNVLAGQYVNTNGNFEEKLATRTLYTKVVPSKQEAYKQGLQQLRELDNSSSKELDRKLMLYTEVFHVRVPRFLTHSFDRLKSYDVL